MNRCYARIRTVDAPVRTFEVIDAPRGQRQSNWYEEAPSGHESVGRVLMRAVDYKQMIDAQTSTGLVLTFGTVPTSATAEIAEERVEVSVMATGATPAVTSSNVDVDYAEDRSDTVEVTLVGLNHWLDRRDVSVNNYNVQSGYELNGLNKPTFRSTGAFLDLTSSPMALYAHLGYVAGPGVFNQPPVELRNLYAVGRPVSETIGRAIDGLGLIGRQTDRRLFNKGQQDPYNATLLVQFTSRVFEKCAVKTTDERYPAQVDVAFTEVGPGSSPGRLHLIRKSSPRGSLPTVPALPVGHWYAYIDPTTPKNATELGQLADWFSFGLGNALDVHSDFGTYSFAGIVNFKIDGTIRRILWHFNANEVSTTLSWNQSIPLRAPETDRKVLYADAVTSRSLDGTDLIIPQTSSGGTGLVARVVSSTAVVANRVWRYSLQEVTAVDGGTSVTYVPTSTPAFTAFNGCENPVDSPVTGWGVGFFPNSPNGVQLIRQAIKNDTVVPVSKDSTGKYVFAAPNGYKVICL